MTDESSPRPTTADVLHTIRDHVEESIAQALSTDAGDDAMTNHARAVGALGSAALYVRTILALQQPPAPRPKGLRARLYRWVLNRRIKTGLVRYAVELDKRAQTELAAMRVGMAAKDAQ